MRAETIAAEFLAFLAALGSNSSEAGELWERFVVTHYAEPHLEAARVALVRASIAAGPWSLPHVPQALSAVAQQLHSSLQRAGV